MRYAMKREEKLQALVRDAHTALLLTADTSVQYYTGNMRRRGMSLAAWEGGCALLPSVSVMKRDGFRALRDALPDGVRTLETEPDALSVSDATQLVRRLPFGVEFTGNLQTRVYLQRVKKEPEEIKKIRQAQSITDKAFMEMLNHIGEGMTDREIQKLIADLLWKYGSQTPSFNHYVSCGRATAVPYARPSGRALRRGDVAMIDVGAQVDGYSSDMTRMIALGEPDEKKRQAFQTVLEAQSAGIAAARVGAVCSDVDGAARAVIEQAGYGTRFLHEFGHPVGAGGREGPHFAQQDHTLLPADIVMTVEPGIYFPKEFGVRVEDMVLISKNGNEVLMGVPRELFVV